MKIQGHTYGDLFYIVCAACLTKTHNDCAEPHGIRTYCPTCNHTATWKLDEFCWRGLPARTTPAHRDRDEVTVRLSSAPGS